ncbi:MAG: pyridoxamine 5'-phosphate oxidase family protein [Oscillospiraceae bacterium]|nr:pyridoxamine 5'-phosphate oxidase family protein [Oscillospiraceae bacterium]
MEHSDYQRAAAYWTNKDSTSAKADRDTVYKAIAAFLGAHKTCALATGSGENVRCTPVDYSFYEGYFYIFTEGGMKFSGLEKNKNVSLAVFDGGGTFGDLHSVQVMGRAEFTEPFCEEYDRIAQIRGIPTEGLKRLKYPMYLLKITPVEMILLDSALKKEGYSNRQIWRCDG